MASRIHRRKPRGRPTGRRTAKANGRKSAVRANAGHVFAHRKSRTELKVHNRHRPRQSGDHAREHGLQHEPSVPALQSNCARLNPRLQQAQSRSTAPDGPETARIKQSGPSNRPERVENPSRRSAKPAGLRIHAVEGGGRVSRALIKRRLRTRP